jgi:hypothetical protein
MFAHGRTYLSVKLRQWEVEGVVAADVTCDRKRSATPMQNSTKSKIPKTGEIHLPRSKVGGRWAGDRPAVHKEYSKRSLIHIWDFRTFWTAF